MRQATGAILPGNQRCVAWLSLVNQVRIHGNQQGGGRNRGSLCELCDCAQRERGPNTPTRTGRSVRFEPLTASASCTPGGVGAFPLEQPFVLPDGYQQVVFARE